MSEYQYYEFLAVDRPLSPTQQQELRALSTRAEITNTRFTNEYNWGDFRGDPEQMMARYFDAMVYVTNWGTRRLMLRLPKQVVGAATRKAYCAGYSLRCTTTAKQVILDFHFNSEDHEFVEDAESWLPSLVSLRADLLRGDLRALYLGWLACIYPDDLDEEQREPPVPPGLRELSKPLTDLADFIYLDEDLLAVASESSTDKQRRTVANSSGRASRRAVSELLAATDRRRDERERMEAKRAAAAQSRRDAKAAKERARYLEELAGRADLAWQQVEQNISALKTRLYRDAAEILVDLRDLAVHQKAGDLFHIRLTELIERHRTKWAFRKELKGVGLLASEDGAALRCQPGG
jgi:hypothetical protein